MSEHVYSSDIVSGYGQAQYPKPQNENQSYFTYSPSLLNTFSPNTNYINNICTNTPTQNVIRNQNSCLNYQDQVDMPNWDNRILPDLEKVIKLPDMIEISSKDLSPVSYCSNIDFLVPELYKTVSKDMNLYKYENQSYYNQNNIAQRNYDYPTCVQYDKSAKYSTLKSYDEPLLKSCSFNTENNFLENEFNTKSVNQKTTNYDTYYDYNTYNYYDRVQENALPIQSDLFSSTNIHFDGIINNIDQQTEDSNEDSDIVVEESDDEQASCEDPDKGDPYSKMNKCLICNVTYKPFGIQFYFLTTKSPLTMSSQVPVIYKIIELVGKISTTRNYLCSECLGLLNTIDHLQIKVDTFNTEFIAKYKKTCIDNSNEYTQKSFVKMADYKNHKITHSTDKKYACTKCENSYKSLYNLRFHMKSHNKELPYVCPICKKGFMRKEYFEAHVNKHNGIKKYGCTVCQKKFPSQKNLDSHMKIHENLKKLPCNICGKLLPSEYKLKDHIRIHTNLKEFECDQCDLKFNLRDSLRKHVRKKHEIIK
ncbi:zinc finger protein 600-like [Diorhabda sublineata]|uniref:zinc finger protein 600-like n=1 Tax=Diorhabda sublineata TaxID=1163346 RepID=UPI0024E1379E|nr:zinc finger protein 600-like [Diorhabda sublineata]